MNTFLKLFFGYVFFSAAIEIDHAWVAVGFGVIGLFLFLSGTRRLLTGIAGLLQTRRNKSRILFPFHVSRITPTGRIRNRTTRSFGVRTG
jgi:hypothetical protein